MSKQELKEKTTVEYLEKILARRALIANPMKLDVPGFGEVIATSMVDYHIDNGRLIPYFTFRISKRKSGEFRREDNKYFVQYNEILEASR